MLGVQLEQVEMQIAVSHLQVLYNQSTGGHNYSMEWQHYMHYIQLEIE